MAKFELEGVGINAIISFSSDKNKKNVVYLSLKAVRWLTIGETSPPSGLVIGRSDKSSCVSVQSIVTLDGGDVLPVVKHCPAFNYSSQLEKRLHRQDWSLVEVRQKVVMSQSNQ